MKEYFIVTIFILLSFFKVSAQEDLKTIAEKTDFKSTSTYNDVQDYINHLQKQSRFIRTEFIATSSEGKEIPLMIIGNPLPKQPEDIDRNKRIVVYIEANIHAGEVEGKEAVLMYVRDLLKEKNSEILKNVVLLICPIFNPDGNDKISPLNRTYQNGPSNGVGVRYNGQLLDLNRDAMKAESPEVRGLIKNVFNKWDPSVFMDCHTTDGSYHIEPVTFTWMVNPAGDGSLISYLSNRMMPDMSRTLKNKFNVENCFYGEFFDMGEPEKGWVLDASEPRYIVNYAGLRNRLGILNENYVYADFKSRVYGCYYLIRTLVDYASMHKSEIRDLLVEADKKTLNRGLNPSVTDSFPIEYKVRPLPEKVTIRTFEAEFVNEQNGWKNYRRTDRQKDVTVPYYIDYFPVRQVKFPEAYLVTTHDPAVVDLLRLHGLKIEKLNNDTKILVEKFDLKDIKPASRINQGHYTNAVSGEFINSKVDFPAGTLIIRTSQPLGTLAAYLLEPQTNDGLVYWNFFDRCIFPQWGGGFNPFPVYKVMDNQDIKSSALK